MKFRLLVAWYDFWVGAYWDSKKRRLYVCILPCLGFSVTFELKSEQKGPKTELGDPELAEKLRKHLPASFFEGEKRDFKPQYDRRPVRDRLEGKALRDERGAY